MLLHRGRSLPSVFRCRYIVRQTNSFIVVTAVLFWQRHNRLDTLYSVLCTPVRRRRGSTIRSTPMKYRHTAKQKLYALAGVILLGAAFVPAIAGAQVPMVTPAIPGAQSANLVNAVIGGAATATNSGAITQTIVNAVNAASTSSR